MVLGKTFEYLGYTAGLVAVIGAYAAEQGALAVSPLLIATIFLGGMAGMLGFALAFRNM